MITITREELLKIASISQIEVTEQEIPALLSEMSAILSYTQGVHNFVEQYKLKKINEQAHKTEEHRRADIAHSCDPRAVLEQAPRVENNYFVVPVIIEHS